jgi:hypothetical protein
LWISPDAVKEIVIGPKNKSAKETIMRFVENNGFSEKIKVNGSKFALRYVDMAVNYNKLLR